MSRLRSLRTGASNTTPSINSVSGEGGAIPASIPSVHESGRHRASHAMVSHTSNKSVMLPSSFSMTR